MLFKSPDEASSGASTCERSKWADPTPTRTQAPQAPATAQRPQGLLMVAPAARQAPMKRLSARLAAQGMLCMLAVCDSEADLDNRLGTHPAQVLVMHTEVAERVGTPCLARLRHQHPDTAWVLAWQGRMPALADLAICTRSRGGLDLDQPAQAVQGVAQVAAGHLWLPRGLLHDLYAALLDERRVLSLGVLPTADPVGPALTRREAAALALMHEGCTNREIGKRLDISVSTVKKHLKNAFDKRGLHSRRQALA